MDNSVNSPFKRWDYKLEIVTRYAQQRFAKGARIIKAEAELTAETA
jgi:hypothetical protein